MNGTRFACFVATACLACGARTPLSSDWIAGSDSGTSSETSSPTVTLSIPLGTYSGCTSATVTTRPNFVGVTGGNGAITLIQQGDSVVATLAFPSYASGHLVFVPTSGGAAAFGASQMFDVQTTNGGFRVVTVTASTGTLSLVGQTLFVSTHGSVGADDVSTFFHCRVPAELPSTNIITSAPPPGRLTARVYRSCTASFSTEGPVQAGVAGGSGSLTVTQNAGTFSLSWPGSLLPELTCGTLDFDAAPVTAVLTAGQSCGVQAPCGPPPTLGPSPFPTSATLTNMQGSMMVNGNSLFVAVLGDAAAQACGIHDLAITCAVP